MSSTPTPNNNITLWQASQSSSATPITTPTPVVTTPTPVVTAQKGVESIIALSSSSDEAVFMGEKSDPLLGANLDDVVTSAGESNWVKKPPRDKNGVVARKPTADEVTRLESINGINIADIGVQHLRGFCKNQKIKATHSQSKKVICDRIVKRKADREKDESCGIAKDQETKKATRTKISRKRFCNVIFSDEIRPFLANRGGTLNKQQLDVGEKTDEALHQEIARAYNNEELYNEDAFPHLQKCRGSPQFSGVITWQKSKDTLSKMVKEYEYIRQQWKLSGFHGDFEEAQAAAPFSNFVHNNNSMLYLHAFVEQYPDILEKVSALLPKEVFSESGGNGNVLKKDKKNKKIKKTAAKKTTANEETLHFFKSASLQRQVKDATITLSLNEKSLIQSKDRKRKLMKDGAERKGIPLREMKPIFVEWRKHHQKRGEKANVDEEDEEEDDYLPDSQESILADILEAEENIEEKQGIIKALKDDIMKYQDRQDKLEEKKEEEEEEEL